MKKEVISFLKDQALSWIKEQVVTWSGIFSGLPAWLGPVGVIFGVATTVNKVADDSGKVIGDAILESMAEAIQEEMK